MTQPDFFFALEFSSQGSSASFLDELTAYVLGHVGCSREEVPGLAGALEDAMAAGAGGERCCDLQFSVRGRTLEIRVSANGGSIWQISRHISRT